ncbi:hypothetical protein QWY20_14075 [Alkalimonas sp. MEB108]|uniref:Lipoprotein n=1 Tax=Alkalimonas cellulosilytica TaxID=3058395 RepID=A0ABU7J8A5_9GAMM|nr:hypothetical protein [Alkalimonas sp. MEB108]MEE2002582.1 hypothetical protein [Alkalimonas sp. MEB108]
MRSRSIVALLQALSLAFACAGILSACVPYSRSYLHINAKVHEREVCGTGAPVTAVFPHGQVTVALTLDPGPFTRREPELAVFVDTDAQVTIAELGAMMHPKSERGPIQIRLVSLGSSKAAGFSYHSQSKGSFVHRFQLLGIPAEVASGVLELPEIVVGSQVIPSSLVTYSRQRHVGVVPLNC